MAKKSKVPVAKPPDDKTRRRLTAYAARVFLERGFRKVTVEELCAGLAMSKRTFYAHFVNRDELVIAVALEKLAPAREAIVENLESDRPVEEVFHRHFDLLINGLFQQVSLQFMTDIQNLMPDVWDDIEQFRSEIVRRLTGLLRRGQAEGSVRPDIDPEVFGKVFQGVLQSFANPNLVASVGLTMQQTAMTFQKIVTGGLLLPPTKERRHEKSTKAAR
jgi:AcrR family transcriptional regulator